MNIAIVTGGSSGIGAAICTTFVEQGWRVLCISRRRPKLDNVDYIALDLAASFDDVSTISSTLDDYLAGHEGKVTLIHNAGEFCHDRADAVDVAYMTRAFQLMVGTPACLNKLLAPHLTAGSSIIYIGSTLSEMAVPGAFSYITLKHALIGMMRATQQDLGAAGVHSCCICPGVTATSMVAGNQAINDAFLSERVSFGRLIAPKEIANFAYFCAISPVINGAVLHSNLGQINR